MQIVYTVEMQPSYHNKLSLAPLPTQYILVTPCNFQFDGEDAAVLLRPTSQQHFQVSEVRGPARQNSQQTFTLQKICS